MSEPKPASGPQVYGYYCSACLADGKLRAVYETPGGSACKKGHGGAEAPLDAAAVLVGGAEWRLGRVPTVGTEGHAEAEGQGQPPAGHWYRAGRRLNWSWSKASNIVLPSWDHPLPDVPGALAVEEDAWFTGGCAMKLYFQLCGVETPSHPAATFGKIGHHVVEAHLNHEKPGRIERRGAGERGPDGFWPAVPSSFEDRGETLTSTAEHVMVARTGAKALTPYRLAVVDGRGHVEQEVAIAYAFPGPVVEDADGNARTPFLDVKGFADVYMSETYDAAPGFGDAVHAPAIGDHKFRSSLDFAPTALQLRFDGQQLTYGFVLSLFHEDSPWRGAEAPTGVFVEHLNFLRPTSGKWGSPVAKCVPVKAFAPWADVEKNWTDRVEVSAARLHTLVQLASKSTPLGEVPYNTNECSAYGGCVYGSGGRKRPGLRLCPRAPGAATRRPPRNQPRRFGDHTAAVEAAATQAQQATQEKNKMSLAAALAAARAKKNNAAPVPVKPEPPTTPVEEGNTMVDAVVDLLGAEVPVGVVEGKSAHKASTFRKAVVAAAGPIARELLDNPNFVAAVHEKVSVVPDEKPKALAEPEPEAQDTIVPPDAAPMTETTNTMVADAVDILKHQASQARLSGATGAVVVLWSRFEAVCHKVAMAPTAENAQRVMDAGGPRIDVPTSVKSDTDVAIGVHLRGLGVPEDAIAVSTGDGEVQNLLSAVYLAVRPVDASPAGFGRPALAAKLAREAAKEGTEGVSSYTTARLKKLVAREGEAQGFKRDGTTPALAKTSGALGAWLMWDEDLQGIRLREAVEPAPLDATPAEEEEEEDDAGLVEAVAYVAAPPTLYDRLASAEERIAVLEARFDALRAAFGA